MIHVIYIAGMSRSGSTILSYILGQYSGIGNIGEATRFLTHSPMRTRHTYCGCGIEIAECPLWSDIVTGTSLTGLPSRDDLPTLKDFPSHYFSLLMGRKLSYQALADQLAASYHSIAQRLDASIIVDSSKHPASALLLASSGRIKLSVVHLYRDPRAVVASYQSRKSYISPQPPIHVTAWWNLNNLYSALLLPVVDSYHTLSYSDLTSQNTATVVTQLLNAILNQQLDVSDGPWTSPNTFNMSLQHTLAGNPLKFDSSTVTVVPQPFSLPRHLGLPALAVSAPTLLLCKILGKFF